MEVEFSEGSTLNLAQFPGHGASSWKWLVTLFMGQWYFGDFKQDYVEYHWDELETGNNWYKAKK